MAFTILIFTAFIAANAAYAWQDDNDFEKRPEFKFHRHNFPAFPKFPTLPNFPHITFPSFPPIVIPTPEDIAKKRGTNNNGMYVSSSSSSTIGKDGKVIQKGGTFMMTNKDGVVEEFVFGDNPSEVISLPPLIIPQIPFWKPIIPVPMTVTQRDIRTFIPGINQNFVGSSFSSYSTSTNVNGVKTALGGTSLTSNVNGDVQNKVIHFEENEV